MTKPQTKMTREQMQNEALIIESLLNSAMALHSGTDPHEAMTMVEMAHDRAAQLNRALDSINASDVGA